MAIRTGKQVAEAWAVSVRAKGYPTLPPPPESREARQDAEIADLKRQYVRDEIDLLTFETWVARVLAGR